MIFFRKIFHGANFFLLILFILVILNLVFTTNQGLDSINQNSPVSFRVVSQKRDNFNQTIDYIQNGFNIYQIRDSKIPLNTGTEYTSKLFIEAYSINSEKFGEVYNKSLGISGEAVLEGELFFNKKCDWYCRILKTNSNIQRNINRTYLNFSCGDFTIISKVISPTVDCKENASLSSGLVTGDTQDFTKETNDNFKKLGLSHLVAVSGFQVVLLTSFLERIFLKLKLSRTNRIIFSFVSIGFLIFLVGPLPPVIRSSLTLIFIYLASILGRSVEYWRALMYSAIVMLFINPFYIYSASFQLSFLASFALGSNIFHQVNPKTFIEKFGQNLFSNINIFFFTLPIIVNLSGFVSPISILVNLILIPVIPIISILNILGLVPIVGQIFLIFPNIFQSFLLFFTNDFGPQIKLLNLASFSFVEIIFYYVGLLIMLILINYRFKNKTVK